MSDGLDTPIGRALAASPGRAALAAGAATTLVALDMWSPLGLDVIWARLVPGVAGLLLLGFLARWDIASLGLRVRLLPDARYWIRGAIAIGLIVLGVVALAALGALILGLPLQYPSETDSSVFFPWFLRSCFGAPVYEELLYRLVFCVAMVALAGRWPAILLSGAVFAFLHVVYGVPSPDNFSAGFVFAWAFFRSGSILVPAVLHSLGNLCVVLSHLAYFWWTHS